MRRPVNPRRLDALLAGLAVVAAALVILPTPGGEVGPGGAPAWGLPYDDPYIHLRYAQAFARGEPFQWSPGAWSTGATSPVYALLLAPAAAITDAVPALSWAARVAGLGSLGWAAWEAAGWARARGLGTAWAALAVAVVAWGSALTFSAAAGMDTALAAAVALRWARLDRAERGLAALAPLVRPDLAILTLATAARGLVRREPAALGVLVPGALWAGFCRWATGEWLPAGAVAKSITSVPFATRAALVDAAGDRLAETLGNVYLGAVPLVFAPGLGLVAFVALVWALRTAPVRPLGAVWLAMVLSAPLSSHLSWQLLRHHQPALALAGVLAVLALGERVRERRWAPPLAGLGALALAVGMLPQWRTFHASAADRFWASHGPVAAWLHAWRGQGVAMATHEAGLFSLYDLGPSVDVLGLGTPGFTRAAIHREGVVLETLARRAEPLRVAAFDPAVVDLAPLLGAPIVPAHAEMVLAPIDRERLGRVDDGATLDFGWLPDEADHPMVWVPPPLTGRASLAILATGKDGEPSYQGCRPVRGRLGVGLAPGIWTLRWAMLPDRSGHFRLSDGEADGALTVLAEGDATWHGAWVETTVKLSGSWLWIDVTDGPLCVESLRPG